MTAGYTRDAFHRGRFWLLQPDTGHRSGMDAMMLAASVPGAFSGALADFGAGAGAAGLAVAARCAGAKVTLIENAPQMLEAAALTLGDPANAEPASRTSLLAADVGLTGAARAQAGLGTNSFDFAIMNPPFNAPVDRVSPDPLRRAAHVMHDNLLENWVRSAAAVVKPRGCLSVIARPESLPDLLAALGRRFGGAQIVPILPRPDKPAIRIIVRAVRASRAGLRLMPPLVLHDAAEKQFSARADAICNGLASLFDD